MINLTIGKQHGAIMILVAFTLAVLLGFAGLVIDLGNLFVAKTELQSALDSCALSAAQELDGAADSTIRARNAGLTAGNFNKVLYQQSPVEIIGAEVEFSETLRGTYSTAYSGFVSAKYARCTHRLSDIKSYLIQLVGGPSANSVSALATATTSPAQRNCALPLGLLPKEGGTASNNYNYLIGEWVEMLYGTSPAPGYMGLFNLDNSNNAPETVDELKHGYCESKIGDPVGTPGTKAVIAEVWNTRFGIYKNKFEFPPPIGTGPDLTGYAYTAENWKNAMPQNAYNGTPTTDSDSTARNFLTKRLAFANYANTGTNVSAGDTITGLDLKGGYKVLAESGSGGEHNLYGGNRRIVVIPVLNQNGSNFTIIDYACMLMLVPFSCNNEGNCEPIHLEYLGLANLPSSPCTTLGLAGGTSGPLVPVLVE